MSHLACRDCTYFIHHYAFHKQILYQVHAGHCTKPRLKRRTPDTKACNHFEPREPEVVEFVTKEYLTKELLQRVLNMELLPEIEPLP